MTAAKKGKPLTTKQMLAWNKRRKPNVCEACKDLRRIMQILGRTMKKCKRHQRK